MRGVGKSCMAGHAMYLELLNRGEIQDHTASRLISVRQRGRGVEVITPAANTQLTEAIKAYQEQGADLKWFCALNYRRFNYTSSSSFRTAMKLAKRGDLSLDQEENK